MTKPLPCPVCGRLPVVEGIGDQHWAASCYAIGDMKALATKAPEIDIIAYGESRSAAIRRWNTLVGKKA